MKLKADLGLAIYIAATEFVDVTDRGGKPYMLHCFYVMNAMRHMGETAMIVGVLHDVVEDTEYTIEKLRELGFNDEVLIPLDNMTHRKGEDYDTYVARAASHPISREGKMRDLEHNMKLSRMKGLRPKDFERAEKYLRAYHYLENYTDVA